VTTYKALGRQLQVLAEPANHHALLASHDSCPMAARLAVSPAELPPES